MKIALLYSVLLLSWCLIDVSDGAWGLRRIFRVVCNTACAIKCVKACPACTPVCGNVCNRVCGKRKRSVAAGSKTLPCDMKKWDTNKDGFINFDGFSSLAFLVVEAGELPLAFEAIDTNKNKRISKAELHKAEFLVGKC